jgi:hypothetical protein
VELSVKALLTILEIDFPQSHGWNEKQLRQIAEQIGKRQLLARFKEQSMPIRLPRLLVLVNLWEQFYIQAKYGIEAGNLAPAQDLFERSDAELAISHAQESLNHATELRFAPEEKLAAILQLPFGQVKGYSTRPGDWPLCSGRRSTPCTSTI